MADSNTMTSNVTAVAAGALPLPTEAAVASFSQRWQEDAAGARWRQQALEALAETAFPDRVQHLWRYTDPELLLPPALLTDRGESGDPVDLPTEGPAVVLTATDELRLNAAAEACGLSLERAFSRADHADLFGQAVPPRHGYFEALNAVAFDAGLVVRAPRGLVLERPLRVIVPAPLAGQSLPRLVVVAEESATLTVVEEHVGGGAETRVIGVTEILAGANSEVRHVLVQRWNHGVRGHLTQRARLERDARFLGATAGLGGQFVKVDLGGVLAGPGARSELVGVTLPEQRQHLDHHTLHQHLSGRTWSNIDFKAAVTDRARSAYTGLIRIEKDAPGSEAFQENRNLLLSERARADTIPELEILTDDVSCSHGATAAPVDPEQLFYLESRGLSPDVALHQIVRGFVETTLRLVPEGLREELEELIDARLDRLVGAD